MNKTTARRIADALTWARIWGAAPVTLLAWLDMTWWFFAGYVAMALTDLFDGFFARRATPSPGARDFDGLADLFFSVMTLVWIWMLMPDFYVTYGLIYLPILVVIEIYLVSSRLRYPALVTPHFEFGRFCMALFCFLLPVMIVFGDQPWFIHSVLVLGTLSKLQLARFFWGASSGQRAGDVAG